MTWKETISLLHPKPEKLIIQHGYCLIQCFLKLTIKIVLWQLNIKNCTMMYYPEYRFLTSFCE